MFCTPLQVLHNVARSKVALQKKGLQTHATSGINPQKLGNATQSEVDLQLHAWSIALT